MRTLFIDLETSPIVAYVWGLFEQNIGINQIIEPTRVICAAWQFDDEPMQFAAEWDGGHKRMVKRLHAALDEADVVVHCNGQAFDIPHLSREFLEAGLMPPSPFKHVDLYLTIRKTFKFPSNKLEYVSSELDVAGGKLETGGMPLWTAVLDGDPDARLLMQEYNEQDVVITRDLYYKVRPWITNGPNAGLYAEGDDPRCPACASTSLQKRGYSYTSAGKFSRFQCTDCGRWSRGAKRIDTTPLREAQSS